MALSPKQAQQFGELIGEVKGIREDVTELKETMKETNKKSARAVKEVGKIKTALKTLAAVGGTLWAGITFFFGGN